MNRLREGLEDIGQAVIDGGMALMWFLGKLCITVAMVYVFARLACPGLWD